MNVTERNVDACSCCCTLSPLLRWSCMLITPSSLSCLRVPRQISCRPRLSCMGHPCGKRIAGCSGAASLAHAWLPLPCWERQAWGKQGRWGRGVGQSGKSFVTNCAPHLSLSCTGAQGRLFWMYVLQSAKMALVMRWLKPVWMPCKVELLLQQHRSQSLAIITATSFPFCFLLASWALLLWFFFFPVLPFNQ